MNSSPSRAIGQPNLTPETGNPNWVDGRELFQPEGIALDTSVTPPIVYVADSINNRVMAWKNAAGFSNGQPADLIIGQPDQYSTTPSGPGTTFSAGMSVPIGVAVLNGDLYVADTGNNRILRFRKPFSAANGNVFPDLWLGQPSLTSNTANYTGSLSASGLKLAGFQSYIAFDSTGNLWVSDPGNNRVLEFPSSSFSCSSCGGMAATTVIGQPNLSTTYPALATGNSSSGVIGNQFNDPSAVAFDASGRLYVADGGVSGFPGRILVFSPPFQPGGMSASGIMGVFAPGAQPTQAQIDATVMSSPAGIFFFADQGVGVLDSGFNRILVFPPYTQWPNQSTTFSPQATAVYGQNDFTGFLPNGAQTTTSVTPVPAPNRFSNPTAAFFSKATNEVYLTDTGNNRAIVLPVLSSDGLGNATRVLGQDYLNQGSINLIEGREFQFIQYSGSSGILDAGLAIDNSGSTPHLYVSDPNNHRILGFKDLRNLQSSAKADIVIGQPNLYTGLCNYPSGDSAQPGGNGALTPLCFPKGITVDAKGNLYVADSGNGRVLRFPAPFSQTFGSVTADLVLGQATFNSSIKDPSNSTMASPYGLAITGTNGLLVSDSVHNRVLYFPFSANGTFTAGTDNGKPATKVFGQPDFKTVTSGSSDAQLSNPHHIACDTNGQFYVADTGNNRLLIFGDPSSSQAATSGQASVLAINSNLNTPEGVYVNPTTGEIWVTNSRSGTAVRYPKFETLLFNQTPLDANPIYAPSYTLAVAQDSFGDLVLADATNRVAFYYPGVYGVNGASFETDKDIAPGMIATIKPLNISGASFGSTTATASGSTWPTTLGGIQLLFNGTAVPLYYVSPGQINFQAPNGAPTSGIASAQVVQAATGQILGAGLLPLNAVSPGIFICGPATGTLRQACVLNQDNSVNSGTNAAARGSVIQIFATGEGFVPNAPPDGSPATAATSSSASLRVFMGTKYVDEIPLQTGESNGGNFVKYSGLAPGLVGVWQINVQIPMAVGPSSQVAIAVVLNGDVADPDAHSGYNATIAVK